MIDDFAAVMLAVTTLVLLASRDWRWSIAALAVQYLGVTILVADSWPVGMALIKLVVGWMSGAALGLTQVGQAEGSAEETSWPSSRVFRLLTGGLVLLVVVPIAPRTVDWLPGVSLEQAWGGLFLIGGGLIQLGMSARPFRVIIGLLTMLAGFEVLYAAVEVSVLVAGLLAAVNLGLALAGAYLLYASAPPPPAVEEPVE